MTLRLCATAASNGLRYLMRRQRLADFQPSRLWLYWYTRMDIMPAEENAPPPDPHEDSGATVHSVCGALLVYHACPESLWPYDDNVYGRFSHAPDLKARPVLTVCGFDAQRMMAAYICQAPEPASCFKESGRLLARCRSDCRMFSPLSSRLYQSHASAL